MSLYVELIICNNQFSHSPARGQIVVVLMLIWSYGQRPVLKISFTEIAEKYTNRAVATTETAEPIPSQSGRQNEKFEQ